MTKVSKAIGDIRTAASMSEQYYGKPLLVCYSGGKDSDALVQLCLEADVACEFQHSHTTADAPETVFHVRERFSELEKRGYQCTISYPRYKGEPTSMWKLIPQKKMPPTRLMRYCCSVLKETAGGGRISALGVRASESVQRSERGSFEVIGKSKKDALRWSSEDAREVYASAQELPDVYDCNLITNMKRQNATVVNPILEWSDRDIYDYLCSRSVKLNPLYSRHYSRVGCIGCPMAARGRYGEFADYPKFKKMYLHAFARMLQVRTESGMTSRWRNADEVMHWYLEDGVMPGQLNLCSDDAAQRW